MKLYFYFSVNDRLFTEASKAFLKHNSTAEFSGLANAKRDFLSDGPFKSISYLSNLKYKNLEIDYDYLLEVENKYNVCIADLINMERHFWRLPKKQRIAYTIQIIKCIEEDYLKLNFNVIFSEGLDDLPSYFLYSFAKALNIPFYYFITSRMGDAVFLSDRPDTGPINMELLFEKNALKYQETPTCFEPVSAFVKSYIADKRQPYYISGSSMLYRVLSINDIKTFANSFKRYFEDKNSYHSYENPLLFPLKRLSKIFRKNRYDHYFKNRFLNFSELMSKRYFVYPLHFHPEAATLIQGKWLNDQRIVIEMVSKALPADVILIVKEHKVSVGRRSLEFYKEIDKYHNVYFVSETTEVYPLIENSLGIVTISSSMGLEAIMMNKPVITFGDINYNILSDVIKARDISKMKDYIWQALNFRKYNETEYWAFFKVITDNVYQMPGYSPHKFSDAHVNTFVTMLEDVSK